jgi:hypothetical protein
LKSKRISAQPYLFPPKTPQAVMAMATREKITEVAWLSENPLPFLFLYRPFSYPIALRCIDPRIRRRRRTTGKLRTRKRYGE